MIVIFLAISAIGELASTNYLDQTISGNQRLGRDRYGYLVSSLYSWHRNEIALGYLLYFDGDYTEALSHFFRSYNRKPLYYSCIGLILTNLSMNKVKDALQIATNGASKFSYSSKYIELLAYVYYKNHQLEKSRRLCEEAIKLRVDSPLARLTIELINVDEAINKEEQNLCKNVSNSLFAFMRSRDFNIEYTNVCNAIVAVDWPRIKFYSGDYHFALRAVSAIPNKIMNELTDLQARRLNECAAYSALRLGDLNISAKYFHAVVSSEKNAWTMADQALVFVLIGKKDAANTALLPILNSDVMEDLTLKAHVDFIRALCNNTNNDFFRHVIEMNVPRERIGEVLLSVSYRARSLRYKYDTLELRRSIATWKPSGSAFESHAYHLCQAELFLLSKNIKSAHYHAQESLKKCPDGSTVIQRLHSIIAMAE